MALQLFKWLRCLSDESAKSLGKHEGSFYQNKLANLSDAAAPSLGNNPAYALFLVPTLLFTSLAQEIGPPGFQSSFGNQFTLLA